MCLLGRNVIEEIFSTSTGYTPGEKDSLTLFGGYWLVHGQHTAAKWFDNPLREYFTNSFRAIGNHINR